MLKSSLIFCLILCLQAIAGAQPEKHYQDQWCAEHHGQVEATLPDKARVDCLTATHAIEFDFAKKWAESIGQALYYANATGKRAGVALIMKPGEERYWVRLMIAIKGLPVDVWVIDGR